MGGMLLKDDKRRAEAIEFLKRGVTVRPGDFRVHANLAQAYRFTGEYELALQSYCLFGHFLSYGQKNSLE